MRGKELIRFRSKVAVVEEKFIKRWLGGTGNEAKFANEPRGWFIRLEDSYESFYAGKTKPKAAVGDEATVEIIIWE